MLSCNDWAFYDSVLATISSGKAVVNDYLYPSTIGLTVPGAFVSVASGNFWVGCTAVLGLLGFLGLISMSSLLARLRVERQEIFCSLLTLMMLPIFLDKWTRFESEVPAFGLALTSLALLIHSRDNRMEFLLLLCASLFLSWSVLIRQNHLVLAVVPLLLYRQNERRILRLLLFAALPVAALVTIHWYRVTPLALNDQLLPRVVLVLTRLSTLRLGFWILCFSGGLAFLLLTMAAPSRAHYLLRAMTTTRWAIATISFLILCWSAAFDFAQLSPLLHVSHLSFLFPYPFAAITLLGALVLPAFIPLTFNLKEPSMKEVFVIIAAAYLVPVIAYGGYWDYYMMEPAAFLFFSGLSGERQYTSSKRSITVKTFLACGFFTFTVSIGAMLLARTFWFDNAVWIGVLLGLSMMLLAILQAPSLFRSVLLGGKIITFAVLPLFLITSWYLEREEIDLQTTSLQIIEKGFRHKVVYPAEINAPYGLTSWNTFERKRQMYLEGKTESLAAWELWNLPHTAVLKWSSRRGKSPLRRHHEKLIESGTAKIGFVTRTWSVWRICCEENKVHFEHRFLPLNSIEWQNSAVDRQ